MQCDAEHFGLDRAAELNPVLPEGLMNQLHVANLLGAVEVSQLLAALFCADALR